MDRGPSSAKAAGLHYANTDDPGLARVRRGGGFAYRTASGRILRDARTLNRIRGLVLPPAWTKVWISRDPLAHLQATGRDARGRKQYRNHPLWTAERDSTKYYRMLAFREAEARLVALLLRMDQKKAASIQGAYGANQPVNGFSRPTLASIAGFAAPYAHRQA